MATGIPVAVFSVVNAARMASSSSLRHCASVNDLSLSTRSSVPCLGTLLVELDSKPFHHNAFSGVAKLCTSHTFTETQPRK